MEYCGPRALPHSVFTGWSDADQDKAIAWMIDKAEICQHCGSYTDEWLDEEFKPVAPPPMFVRSTRCHGCITLTQEEDLIRGSFDGMLPPGMRVYFSRQPPPPREEDEGDEAEDSTE